MSRRERDTRDSHGKRLHSRFDRGPSPKKLKRDEKPEVNFTHTSHRNSSIMEATHEQKQRPVQDDVPLKAPPASSTPGLQKEKNNLERKVDKPPVTTQHSSDNLEAPRPRSYYQHEDRGTAGQGGRNLSRRAADSREHSGGRARDDANDQPKKDERSQPHADEKASVWRHDRFHELESRVPALKKRPAFREKKMPPEPEADTAAAGLDKTKLSTREPPVSAASERGEQRGGFYPRALDKPDRTFTRADDRRERRGDGPHNRGEVQRNADLSRERYGAMRGRGDRPNVRYGGARDPNRAGGFEVEKWKHDLFDEANRSPPRKNEEEQIAKVEALLAL